LNQYGNANSLAKDEYNRNKLKGMSNGSLAIILTSDENTSNLDAINKLNKNKKTDLLTNLKVSYDWHK
jgi:hypothetical protein